MNISEIISATFYEEILLKKHFIKKDVYFIKCEITQ